MSPPTASLPPSIPKQLLLKPHQPQTGRRWLAPVLSLILLAPLSVSCATSRTSQLPETEELSTKPAGDHDADEHRGPDLALPSPYDWPEVVAIRQQARALLREQAKAYWQSWTRGEPLNLAGLYEQTQELFSAESLQAVRSAREEAAGRPELKDDAKALKLLELFIAGEIISQATAELADEAYEIELEATLSLGRFEMPFRELERLLAQEGSAVARQRLYRSAGPTLEKLNPLLEARQKQSAELAESLGYGGYAEFGALLREADLDELKSLAQATLKETENLYIEAMNGLSAAELNLPLENLRRADIPRLFRGPGLRGFSPEDGWEQAARRTFASLGFELDEQQGLILDLSTNPLKHPRAACFPVDVPDDIRVSVKPQDSLVDMRALLHELGHALAYLHSRRPEWELRQLGSNVLAETWAFLFDGLWDNPDWLAWQGLSPENIRLLIRSNATQKLYTLRRYSAKVLLEIDWHTGRLEKSPQEAYAQYLSQAYGFELDENDAEHHLLDHDEFFTSADYLRAWYLAAQVEHHLRQRFGQLWWKNPEAGELLVSLWREGSRLDSRKVAQRLGDADLEPKHLWNLLQERLTAPSFE